jgi:hypothetical protein
VSGDEVSGGRPLLRVVRGNPDDTELAVLTAVVSALATAANHSDEPAGSSLVGTSRWGAPQLRRPLRPGPGAWQFSHR